jgi:UDP-N-acetylmuramoylalanine--D-glutamate ligase
MRVEHKHILIVGLGVSGVAAARLALVRGAKVSALDSADTETLQQEAAMLREDGVVVTLGVNTIPEGEFDLAIVSPGIGPRSPLYRALAFRRIPVIGELEFGQRECGRPTIAITGTNGKTTTTELIDHVLNACGKRSVAAGNIGLPVCQVAQSTDEFDFVTLEVSSFQLETIEYFRPAVGVLLNLSEDHMDRHETMVDYARAKARMFGNQQAFDWAVMQSEALAYLRSQQIDVPSQVITFSSNHRRADLYLDRSLIVGALPEWDGPLLAMQQTSLRGAHNAENVMAALAVGRILQLPLEKMVRAIKSFKASPHRCEFVTELGGVHYVNDSKATNVDAMMKAIDAMPSVSPEDPNIWLIAGGSDKGFEFHAAGPLLARRVKGVFLIGETADRMNAAWHLFATCVRVDDLADAVHRASEKAELGDVVLLSPSCASFDQFTSYAERGNCFKEAVAEIQSTRCGDGAKRSPQAIVSLI